MAWRIVEPVTQSNPRTLDSRDSDEYFRLGKRVTTTDEIYLAITKTFNIHNNNAKKGIYFKNTK